MKKMIVISAASKVTKYIVFSGPYFLVLSPNTGKYGPEKTPYLDTFHAVLENRGFENAGFFSIGII